MGLTDMVCLRPSDPYEFFILQVLTLDYPEVSRLELNIFMEAAELS